MLEGQIASLPSDRAYAGSHHRPVATDPVSSGNGVKQDDVARVAVVLNTGIEGEVYGKTTGSGVV